MRGLGRCILAVDKLLTNENDPASYEATTMVNGGNRLILDLRTWEQKFAFYYGTYEPELVGATTRLFTGGVFYDIGASIGIYAVTMANVCKAHCGYVRAFEPVPTNLRRLEAQISENELGEELIQIERIALSNEPGTAMMDLCDDGKPGNAKITSSGQVSVEVTLLDNIWAKRNREPVDFVKIDTEGWDANIITGGREMIRECRPNLLVEFNRERMTNHGIPLDPAWEFLVGEMKYRVFYLDEQTGVVEEVQQPGDLENLFFVREDDVERILR
ncbi:FkbM family methyltransferase [Rhodopirellula maiorica SM1]|uniref:FkbM family methyltransferase n=2 Tax=Novipirellula TaxID=2795426 RepID=M5REW1_9BACT|nr:FkbM family methyltransferase [Rhodopirellula maiorica SM1]